jgi:hypothetical protein
MYQIHLRNQAVKLALLIEHIQQRAFAQPRPSISSLRAALAGLAQLAILRALPDAPAGSIARPDPRDPQNW